MATFMARVNASLPTNEPDVFLLSLIKGQTRAVCGPTCGSSEVVSGGRCIARTVVAEKPTAPVEAGSSGSYASEPAPMVVAARPDPPPGRMSIGGPIAPQPNIPTPVTEPTVPVTEPLPWQNTPDTMASLDPDDPRSGAELNAPPVARKMIKMRKAWSPPPKPAKRRYSSTRSVQQLFMHPLGRM